MRIAFNWNRTAGTRTVLGKDELVAPNGLALDWFGRVYVSNASISAGAGEVVRVNY